MSVALMIEDRKTGRTTTANIPTDGVLYNFYLPNDPDGKGSVLTAPVTGTHVSHNNPKYAISSSGGGGQVFDCKAGTPVAIKGGEAVDISRWSVRAVFQG